MKKLLFTLCTVASCLLSRDAVASATEIKENFDSVTVPALPSGWNSQSLIGAQTAITTTTTPNSNPNAALLPNPSSLSETALNSPIFNFSTGLPNYALRINFRHKRAIESTFDGGVLEVSINGAPFKDILSPSIGGAFNLGGYNSTVSTSFGNPLAGRSAWSGTSAIYESVSAAIPSIPDNATVQFRFVIGTDSSVSAGGWRLDDFGVTPETDLSAVVAPQKTEISPGGEVAVNIGLLNPASVEVTLGTTFLHAPSSIIKNITFTKSGVLQRYGTWLSYFVSIEPTAALSTEQLSIVVQDTPNHGSAKLTVNSTPTAIYTGIEGAFPFLSSSPDIPGGTLTAQPTYGTIDPCAPPAFVLPTIETGKIVFDFSAPSCPYGQAALAYQARGARAYIVMGPPLSGSVGSFTSAFVSEPAQPGLSIPVLTFDPISAGAFLSSIGAPGTTVFSLEGRNTSEIRTIAVNVENQPGDDPKLGNNFRTSLINVVTDVDGDGTPDIRDGCKADPAKTAAGICGCGIADTDANSNGIADCLVTADFKAQVQSLQSKLKKLSFGSKGFKAQKAAITKLKKEIASFGVSHASSITVSSSSINIATLTKKADKAVAAALKAGSASALAKAKQAAAKELAKLIKGIA